MNLILNIMAKLNIPRKNSGDTLSANEFNQIVDEINNKIDRVGGKILSSNDYTDADKSTLNLLSSQVSDISSIVNLIRSGSRVIQDTERICGTYRIAGTELNLYECAFKLEDLPTSEGATKEYKIADTPLGKNTYLAVSGLTTIDGNSFYPGMHSVEKAFVDLDYNARIVVRCERTTNISCYGVLSLQYVKMEYEVVEFDIKGLSSESAANAQLSMPILKYDKRFAYSYTFDDDTILAYSRGHLFINKKWQDDEKNYHAGMPKGTGGYPSKTLGYTDGLGIERRFALGVAIWPDSRNQNIDDIMNPTTHSANKYYPYLVWNDIRPMLEFGHEIYFHDVDTNGDNTVDGILKGLKKSQAITLSQLPGHGMKVIAEPNGNHDYLLAGERYEDISFMCAQGANPLGLLQNIGFAQDLDLRNKVQFRRYVESTPDANLLMTDISAKATSGLYQWYHDFSHGPSEHQYIKDLYVKLNDTFGKDGDDTIWFATLDEVYEYWFVRRYAKIRKEVLPDRVKYSVLIPKERFFRHKEFTLQLNGNYNNSLSAELTKGNAYGFAFGNINNKFSININLEKRVYDMADKYSNIYLESQDEEARNDALYFISQLREDLKTQFNNRITSIDTAPVLTSIRINGGASVTNSRQVSVTLVRTGVITHYKISETPNMGNTEWLPGADTMIPFVLGEGYGTKTIYVKIKNNHGESAIVSSSISFEEAIAETLVLNSISINGGAGSATVRNVTVGMSVVGTPTHYMLSESPSFNGASWMAYSGTSVLFALSSGNGEKTVYCKIKDSTRESVVKSSVITLSVQDISSSGVIRLSINDKCSTLGYNAYVPYTNRITTLKDAEGVNSELSVVGADIVRSDFPDKTPLDLSLSVNYNPEEYVSCIYPYDVYRVSGAHHSNNVSDFGGLNIKVEGNHRYKIKVFASTKFGSANNYSNIIYDINGVSLSPVSPVIGNTEYTMEWADVTPENGWITIKIGRKTPSWITAVVNVVEFERID